MSDFTKGPWVVLKTDAPRLLIMAKDPQHGCVAESFRHSGPTPEPLTVEANAHLIAQSPAMYEALEDLVLFFEVPGESANEHFERTAAVFHADTGLLAPGKDAREGPSHEERIISYQEWTRRKVANAIKALAAARGES